MTNTISNISPYLCLGHPDAAQRTTRRSWRSWRKKKKKRKQTQRQSVSRAHPNSYRCEAARLSRTGETTKSKVVRNRTGERRALPADIHLVMLMRRLLARDLPPRNRQQGARAFQWPRTCRHPHLPAETSKCHQSRLDLTDCRFRRPPPTQLRPRSSFLSCRACLCLSSPASPVSSWRAA